MGGAEGASGQRDRCIITADSHSWTARHGKASFLQQKHGGIFFFNLEKQGEK